MSKRKTKEEIASQKKSHSFMEAIVNVLVGLCINLTAQVLIFPLFGIHIPLSSSLEIAGIFTVISIIRSFVLRRVFNGWHVKLATT